MHHAYIKATAVVVGVHTGMFPACGWIAASVLAPPLDAIGDLLAGRLEFIIVLLILGLL